MKNNLNIIDMHCDTLLACLHHDETLDVLQNCHITSDLLKKGGCMVQCLAGFIVSGKDWLDWYGWDYTPYELYKKLVERFNLEMEHGKDYIRPVRSKADILKNVEEGMMSALFTIEDCMPLDGRIERVDEMYNDGVRIASITWNHENSLAYPNRPDPEEHMKGLKPFGVDAIRRMFQLGIIPDVSHLSEGGFWDLVKLSKEAGKPFVATHSCARALCSHQRNLTDEQLKAVGECGGMVGVNFLSDFLVDGATYTSVDDVVRHMVYIADKAGVEALGFGSDFDGIECGLEFENYGGFPMILEAASKHFTAREMDMICHDNFLRIIV